MAQQAKLQVLRLVQDDNLLPFREARPLSYTEVNRGRGTPSLFPCFLESGNLSMLAKVTAKNQLTLPKAVASRFPGVEHFDISTDGESIVLRPLRRSRLDEVHAHIERLGITEKDVKDAVAWARRSK
jgi:bifunctional DNA-binding transcriptional regulator/antitoxin component of YhaV-PrlF toxin-antitoxin module